MADTTAPKPAKAGGKRRAAIASVISVVVLIAVFALLMPQVASYEDALSELATIPSEWIVALVASGILNIALYPLTVMVAIPTLGYWRGFVERQSGFLVSNTVPAGGAIAVATQYAVLAHYRVRASLAAAAVSTDSVLTYLLTLGLPALAVVLLVLEGDQTSPPTVIAAALGLILVFVSVLVIKVVLRSDDDARKVGGWGERLIAPVLKRLHKPTPDLQSLLVSFRKTAHDLLRRKWRPLLVTNGFAQLTPLLVLFCALAGLGAYPDQLTLIEIFAAYSLALLFTMIPLTPGGLGTVDAALVALLTSFGASGSVAVAADVVWRLVWFLPQLLSGAAAMIVYVVSRNRRRKREESVEG